MPLFARHGECAKGLLGSATHLSPSPGRSGGGRAERRMVGVQVGRGPMGAEQDCRSPLEKEHAALLGGGEAHT
jgi:hypothetical protein